MYFKYFEKQPPSTIAEFIQNEYPQTIVTILVNCEEELANKIITYFDKDLQIEVLVRMNKSTPVTKTRIRLIDKILKKTLSNSPRRVNDTIHRDERVKKLFSIVDEDVKHEVEELGVIT